MVLRWSVYASSWLWLAVLGHSGVLGYVWIPKVSIIGNRTQLPRPSSRLRAARDFVNPYDDIGVAPTATADAIKSKYESERVRRASNAEALSRLEKSYSLLSSPKYRQQVDIMLEKLKNAPKKEEDDGFMAPAAPEPEQKADMMDDPFQLFANLGGENLGESSENSVLKMPFSSFFSSPMSGSRNSGGVFGELMSQLLGAAPAPDADIRTEVTIPLRDALRGSEVPIRVKRIRSCGKCESSKCADCGGSGMQGVSKRTRAGFFRASRTCSSCGGNGRTRDCNSCDGSGHKTEKTELRVEIPAGSGNGTIVRVKGAGHFDGENEGDLLVKLNVKNDVERRGSDTTGTVEISYLDAVLGKKGLNVELPDGRSVQVDIPEGSQQGDEIRVAGGGAVVREGSEVAGRLGGGAQSPEKEAYKRSLQRRGDHILRVIVQTPKRPGRAEVAALRSLRDRGEM